MNENDDLESRIEDLEDRLTRTIASSTALEVLMEIVFAQYWADESPASAEQKAKEIENLILKNPEDSQFFGGPDPKAVLFREALGALRRILRRALVRASAVRDQEGR